MGIKITKTIIEGVYIIEPDYYCDNRGYYAEVFSERTLRSENIILKHFVQDSHSYNKQKGTIRGIHFQNKPHNQTKIVRCIRGSMLDCAVDLRKNSPTYLKSVVVELSETNHKQLLIPNYCGHGYVTLEDDVEMMYKLDDFWHPECEGSVNLFDKDIDINWPIPTDKLIYNEKDKKAPLVKDANIDLE